MMLAKGFKSNIDNWIIKERLFNFLCRMINFNLGNSRAVKNKIRLGKDTKK